MLSEVLLYRRRHNNNLTRRAVTEGREIYLRLIKRWLDRRRSGALAVERPLPPALLELL
jgi:hypothetical protein